MKKRQKQNVTQSLWGENSIFPTARQECPTQVDLPNGVILKTGVQSPFKSTANSEYLKGFDTRHAEVIFKLLAFYQENDIDFNHKVDMSYYKLLQIIGWERENSNLENLKEVLDDLINIWTMIITENEIITFKILQLRVTSWDSQKNENINLGIAFGPMFLNNFLLYKKSLAIVMLELENSLLASPVNSEERHSKEAAVKLCNIHRKIVSSLDKVVCCLENQKYLERQK